MEQHAEASEDRGDDGPDIAAVYEQHKAVMHMYARRLADGDEDLALELVQDVMLGISKNKPRGIENWQAYLIRALRNKVVDRWKSAQHRHELLMLKPDSTSETERKGGDDVAPAFEDEVLDEIERQETAKTVRDALAELQSINRNAAYAFEQSKVFGRTSDDIGAELGVSGSRARQLVMKARAELINILNAKGVNP